MEIFLGLVVLVFVLYIAKNTIDSFAREFWKDVEAALCTVSADDVDGAIKVVGEALQRVDTGKLPIVIKHAPNPIYRRMAQDAYAMKKSLGI